MGIDQLIDEYLDAMWAESPTAATHQGVPGHDHDLPDLSESAIAEHHRRDDQWRERFAALPDRELSFDEQIDRDLVLASLDGKRALRPFERWRRQPDTYLSPSLMGTFALFLRRPGTEAERAAAAISRLTGVAAVLAEGRANLEPELVPPIFVERAIGQCRAGAGYARDLVPAEVEDPGLRAKVAAAGAEAATAFTSFADHLESIRDRCHGDFAIGADLYSAVLEDGELLGYGSAELHRRGQVAYDQLEDEMVELAERIEPGLGWRATIEKINTDHPATPEEMREGYERCTADARQYLIDHDLVTFLDSEHCDVVPSPVFQRPLLAVASYTQPPSFGAGRTGRFNVPFPPDTASDAEIQQRLSNNSWQAMPTIAVHEAYPGHHWHLVTMNESRPIRRVVRSSYFAEGWGLYSELMMREEGFFTDPRAELCHLDFRLFRAARIIVDTSLHSGDMNFDEAVRFMHTKASLSEPNARAEVGRYCSMPTQASSYLTGSLEIERLRDGWFAADRGNLKAFHDTIANTGSMPIALTERAVAG